MPGPPDCRTRPRTGRVSRFPPVPDARTGDGVCSGTARRPDSSGTWRWRAGQLRRHRRRKASPNFAAQGRQRTEAGRSTSGWPPAMLDRSAAGPARSRPGLAQLLRPAPTGGRPGARPAGTRACGSSAGRPAEVRRLNRKLGRRSGAEGRLGPVPAQPGHPDAKSYRVTRDSAGRWHIALAAIPAAIPPRAPAGWSGRTGAWPWPALSSGELRRFDTDSLDGLGPPCPAPAVPGPAGQPPPPAGPGQVGSPARPPGRRPQGPGAEAVHRLARRFALIRVEDLRVRTMTRSAKGTVDAPGPNVRPKAGLNRAILDQGWGVLVTRLEQGPRPGGERSTLRTRRRGATPAGTPRRSRARAKRASSAGPAATPRTPT